MSRRAIGTRINRRHITALTPCDEQVVDALEGQQRVTSWPYYSTVKFQAVRSGASGAYLYTMTTQTRGLRAFGYALGDTKEAAGYSAADGQATACDTNIITKNQTISGQYVAIRGIALQWHSTAINVAGGITELRPLDGNFVSALMRCFSVEMGVNGDANNYKMGTIGMIPGAGGLQGGAQLLSGLNVLDGNANTEFASNGWPTRSNFFRVPEGVLWTTSDQSDGNLNVIFRQEEALVIQGGGSVENLALGVDSAAVVNVSMGYNYPAVLSAELKVFIIGETIAGRSKTG